MKIWLINQYATLPDRGIGGRHRHIPRELALLGHKVTVIAARWTHLTRDSDVAKSAPPIEDFEGYRFVNIDLPRYGGAHDKRRILNWFRFGAQLPGLPRRLGEVPDVVIYSSPSPVGFLGAQRLARKTGAKLVFEVRDIWPLTLIQLGGASPRHPFIRLLSWIEARAYRSADLCLSNLKGAGQHMQDHGLAPGKFAWIPNGISQAEMIQSQPLSPQHEARLPKGGFVIGYAGTMGLANALDQVLDAAALLRDEPGISFVLVGEGDAKTALQARAHALGLSNVLFLDAIPKAQVPSLLARFDACLISWNDTPLYRYGVAANKIFDYFLAAKPVLHAYGGGHDPVRDYGAGLSVPPGDAAALAKACRQMAALSPQEREQMGRNGHEAVLAHHDYARISARLADLLDDLVTRG